MKSLYISEIREDLAEHPVPAKDIIKDEDIKHLPKPVQRYFRNGGFIGREKMYNAIIRWEDVYLKMSPDKKWTPIHCYQYNSISGPVRLAYMKSKGILPFEGRDKFQHGHGNMLIKLLKIIPVGDSKGEKMDESALVTILAESLLIPSYSLQNYIYWEELDENTAKATMSCNGVVVSGTFHFNNLGEMLLFVTNDRNYTENDGSYRNIKWSAIPSNYKEQNGIRFPGTLKAVWHLPTGDYEYFKGKISDLEFNIGTPEEALN